MVIWSLPDVLAIHLVVLPPDVAGGDVLVTSDPYVFAVRCFLLPLMVDRIYIWGRVLIILLLFWDCRALSFSCVVVSLELARTSLSVYPRSQVAQPWKINSFLPPFMQQCQVVSCTPYPVPFD